MPRTVRTKILLVPLLAAALACSKATDPVGELDLADEPMADATVGASYRHTFAIEGGTPPFTFSAQGLPEGLTLDARAGRVNGTPVEAGENSIALSVTDAVGLTADGTFALKVFAAPAFTSTTLPDAAVGVQYAALPAVHGGKAPLTLSLASGALPAGLTLSAEERTVSGNPSANGTFEFTLRAEDANGAVADQAFNLVVHRRLNLTTTALPAGEVGVAYSAQLQTSGGKAPLRFEAAGLPAGLSVDEDTGLITGTPSASVEASVAITVEGQAGSVVEATLTLEIVPAVRMVTAALADAYAGQTYAHPLEAADGRAPYSWSTTEGQPLPAGLVLDPSGAIAGSASAAGSSTVGLAVTDSLGGRASRLLALTVLELPAITTAAVEDAYVGEAFSISFAGTGGRLPYAWSVESGTLPEGLVLSQNGNLTGTPISAGSAPLVFQLTDANGRTATRALVLRVLAPASIGPEELPDPYVGTSYQAQLSATGGLAPVTFVLSGGTLPPGLTLSSSGSLSGTPGSPGPASFQVTATDANGVSSHRTFAVIVRSPPAVDTTELPVAYVNALYLQTLQASAGRTPYTWSLSAGALPAGLSLDGQTGAISGTPTGEVGTATFTVRLTDANGVSATRALSIQTLTGLGISTASLPEAYVGRSYTVTLQATGGLAPYAWSLASGNLPSGLTLGADGELSGTPEAAGQHTLSLRATDGNEQTVTRQLVLTILAAPEIATTTLDDAYPGVQYAAVLEASGGKAPFTWAVAAGPLPGGLSLGTGGEITGTPTTGQAGVHTFTVRATDANGIATTGEVSLSILAAPQVDAATLADAYLGAAYEHSFTASQGRAPFTWTVSAGAPPAGLTLSTATGRLSGTATAAGSADFTVRATDANGQSAQRAFTLAVFAPPAITTTGPLAEAWQDVPYSVTLAATGGKSPLAWSISDGALPQGLSLSETGEITGTPAAREETSFSVTITDANGRTDEASFALTVHPRPAVVTSELPDAYREEPLTLSLEASGGKGPYSWLLASGSLPAGVALGSNGTLSGAPAETGTFAFVARVTDAHGLEAQQPLALHVLTLPTISTAGYDQAYAGLAYSATTAASGGRPPYAFGLSAGALPAGLTLDPELGTIAGTPEAAGTASFTLQVADANGREGTRELSLEVLTQPSVTSTDLEDAYVGEGYQVGLAATGGRPPYEWSLVEGPLPAGMTFTSTGRLAGTPTEGGDALLEVQVTDENGVSATGLISFAILPMPQVITDELPEATEGFTYEATLAAAGGRAPFTFSFPEGLPPGLSLEGERLEGAVVPGAAEQSPWPIEVLVTDANGRTGTRTLLLEIREPRPIPGGGLTGGPIKDTMTVFVVDWDDRPVVGAGVRVRRNGQEYDPVKEALTDESGRVWFSGLDASEGDSFDVTVNGHRIADTTLARFNAQLWSFNVAPVPVPLPRHRAAAAWDPAQQRLYVTGGLPGENEEQPGLMGAGGLRSDLAVLTSVLEDAWEELLAPGLPGNLARESASAAFVGGALVVYGGRDETGTPSRETWRYRPSTGGWDRRADGPTARWGASTAVLDANRFLVFGGQLANGQLANDLWMYDAGSNTWTLQTHVGPPSARLDAAMTSLPGAGKVLLYGGRTSGNEVSDETWMLDVPSGEWTRLETSGETLPPLEGASLAAVSAQTAYLFGGSWHWATPELYRFDGTALSWERIHHEHGEPWPSGRAYAAMAYASSENRLVLFGGGYDRWIEGDTWTYNLDAGLWVPLSPQRDGNFDGVELTVTLTGGSGHPDASGQLMVFGREDGGVRFDRHEHTHLGPEGEETIHLRVPRGRKLAIAALEVLWDGSEEQILNFASFREIGPFETDAVEAVTFPSPAQTGTLLEGTFHLPAAWGSVDDGGGDVRGGLPGYRSIRTGRLSADLGSGTFSGLYLPQPEEQLELFFVSTGACMAVLASETDLSGPLALTLPEPITAVQPGLSECSEGTLPVASEADITFSAPEGTIAFDLSAAPEGSPTRWRYTSRAGAGPQTFTPPEPSTLAPSQPRPSGQQVRWQAFTVQAGPEANLDDFEFERFPHSTLVATGAQRFVRE